MGCILNGLGGGKVFLGGGRKVNFCKSPKIWSDIQKKNWVVAKKKCPFFLFFLLRFWPKKYFLGRKNFLRRKKKYKKNFTFKVAPGGGANVKFLFC